MKKVLLSIMLALPAFLSGYAQVLSIDDCVRLSRENYPVIAQYGLLDRISELNLSNLAKGWLPQGSVSGQLTWQNDVAALPEGLTNILAQQGMDYPGLMKTQYRVGVDVAQRIWDGGRSEANKKVVRTGNAVERTAVDLQLYDLEGRVEELYFSILLTEERIARTNTSITLVDSTLNQVRSLYENGVATKSDCDQIEAGLLTLRQQHTRLMSASGSLRKILEIFIAEPIGQRILQLPPDDSDADRADNHPQLRLFADRLSNLTAQESGIKASVMPDIGAFASGYYGYPGYNMFKNMQSHDPSFNFMVGIKVAWNFGSLYTRGNSLKKLELQRQQIETDRNVFLFNNDIAMTGSMTEIATLREVMKSDEKIVELRRAVMRAAQSQLRNGVIDATTLLTKITDTELAENDLTLHKIELVKAMYNLKHLKNK